MKKTTEQIRAEIARRESIVYDQLIGQSPENLEYHYRLIGRQETLRSLLKFIDDDQI